MSDPIVYIDRSEIREGKLGQLKAAIVDLVGFVEDREPQLISYAFYIEDGTLTVVAVHPDSASLEFHMDVGGPRFQAFAELLRLRSIEVYGRPSEAARQRLEQKAAMLGDGGGVVIHELEAGFERFGARGG